jgi:hypothetical protein
MFMDVDPAAIWARLVAVGVELAESEKTESELAMVSHNLKSGITLLAKKSGIPHTTLSSAYQACRVPSMEQLQKISAGIGKTVDWILWGTSDPIQEINRGIWQLDLRDQIAVAQIVKAFIANKKSGSN